MSETSYPSIEERISVIEERTAPKKKSTLDIIKDWSGLATAVVAILYSFPLGIWDYWITSPINRETDALRSAVVQLADLEARQTQGFASITDAQARIFFSNAMGSQRAALLARVQPLIAKRINSLSTPEIAMLGYNLAQYGLQERALSVYQSALDVAVRDNAPLSLRADIYRMMAQIHANNPSGANISEIRKSYLENIRLLSTLQNPVLAQQAANSAFEWSLMERIFPDGNWACSEALRLWAISHLAPVITLNPNAAVLMQAYGPRLANIPQPADQVQTPCPAEVLAAVPAR